MKAVAVNMDQKEPDKATHAASVSFNKFAPLFKYLSQDLRTSLSEAKHSF